MYIVREHNRSIMIILYIFFITINVLAVILDLYIGNYFLMVINFICACYIVSAAIIDYRGNKHGD